jgi:GT2 family glycosyltransferase/glycosyltransferase involved in cell wall biosynthesis
MKAKTLVKNLVRGARERQAMLPSTVQQVNHAAAACRLLCGRDPTAHELAESRATNDPVAALRYFLGRQDHQIAFNHIIATRQLPRGRYLTEPDGEVVAFLSACGVLRDSAPAGRPNWRELIKTLCRHLSNPLKLEFRAARRRGKLVLWALGDDAGSAAKQADIHAYLLAFYLNLYGYFDAEWYRHSGAMAVEGPSDPLEHYLKLGARRGFAPSQFFDPAFYRASIGREIPAYRPDIVDYCTLGWMEGGQPCPAFAPADYLRANPDVAAALFEPLSHYVRFGRAEGRPGGVKHQSAHIVRRPAINGIPMLGRPYEKLIGLDPKPRQPSRPANPNRLRADWVIPDFVPGAGGHMAIFKLIYWLEAMGYEVHIWIDYPAKRNDVGAIYQDILRYFRPLKCQVHMLSESDHVETDALFLTDRWSVWSGLKAFKAHATFYFVQDLETEFFGAGSEMLMTEKSYQLGLPAICSSPWLAQKMRGYGSEVVDFIYPADTEIYYPAVDKKPSGKAPTIAFYSRAATGRRAVELAILGLIELHNRGIDFTVAMFGQAFEDEAEMSWPFAVEYHGVLTERGLGDLFRRADVGLVLSATNYSITAIEMMACGLPIVDIDVESTRATYPDETAILAEPTPKGIADALQAAFADADRTRRHVANALTWVSASRWRDIADRVDAAIRQRIETAGGLGAPQPIGRALKATVVIPTFNGEERLAAVLDAVTAQRGPIEFDILCIDSGSTDETLKIIGERERVRLHQILQSEFNHGDTRNLGVELSDSDYVAFLTQDALPRSDTWLFDLVGVLDAVPSAAGAFGRHFAYTEASPFTKRDMDQHFDMLKRDCPVVSTYADMGRFDERDPKWVGMLRFFSNNNSCISKKAWRRIPFPRINFGEDQTWAWKVLKAGYSKVYVDAAAVCHSHDYDTDQERRRARTEAAFYRLEFDVDFGFSGAEVVQARTDFLNGGDLAFAIENKIDWPLLEARMKSNRARMEGFLLGADDHVVVY